MVSCGMVGAQCSSHGSLMALSCLMEGAKGQVLGHQNKATTFSSTPSLFFTLPLNIIAAKNHTLATFNSGEAGCKQLALNPIFASIINVALFTN